MRVILWIKGGAKRWRNGISLRLYRRIYDGIYRINQGMVFVIKKADKRFTKLYCRLRIKIEALNKEIEKKETIPQQSLTAYETRRNEIANSSEKIDGIFYIYNGQIIPDYFSECLLSDRDRNSIHRKSMFHMLFYPNYMLNKFTGLSIDSKSLPRGRANYGNSLLIDKCYCDNEDIIQQLKELYRLPQDASIITCRDYTCPACRS